MTNKHDILNNCHPERIRSDNGATKKSKDPEDIKDLMAAVVLFHDDIEVCRRDLEANN